MVQGEQACKAGGAAWSEKSSGDSSMHGRREIGVKVQSARQKGGRWPRGAQLKASVPV